MVQEDTLQSHGSIKLKRRNGERYFPLPTICVMRNKKRNHVYLAGSISRDIRTYEWREEFEDLMEGDPNFVIVNPCKNKFNQSLRDYKGDNSAFIKEAVSRSQGILKPKLSSYTNV